MAKLELNGVHKFSKIPGSHQFALSAIHPALRLCQREESLYIQHGQVFTPGGDPVAEKNIPAWFHEELGKCGPKALAECGWKGFAAKSKPQAKQKPAADAA